MALIKPTQTKSKDALVNGESSIITLLCRFFWGLNSLWIMFLLLWLQTIPSQTALSGANPISRRIAELSGCVGVCAHGRTAGSQWEQTTLPAASLSSLLRSPLLPSRAQGSEAGKLWAKLHLGNHLPVYAAPVPGGLWKPWCYSLQKCRGGHGCSPCRRKGKSWEAEAPQNWGPPAFPHVPQAQLSLHPHKIPKGAEA